MPGRGDGGQEGGLTTDVIRGRGIFKASCWFESAIDFDRGDPRALQGQMRERLHLGERLDCCIGHGSVAEPQEPQLLQPGEVLQSGVTDPKTAVEP